MARFTSRTVPWAILLAVIFASVVLYFAAMLEVIGQVIARVPVKNYIARMEQVLGERPGKAAKKKK